MKSQKWTISFLQARIKKVLIGLEDAFHEKTKMMQPELGCEMLLISLRFAVNKNLNRMINPFPPGSLFGSLFPENVMNLYQKQFKICCHTKHTFIGYI